MAKYSGWKYILLFVVANFVTATRVKDMIYMSFDGVAACFRRHNGTHQFGCSSSRSGSIGVIHIVEAESDVDWLEKQASVGPYMVVMPFSMFTRPTLTRLRDTNNISGVLLAKNVNNEYPKFYSPEDTCPNRYSGYQKCNDVSPWNPYGSALLFEDWPFPMFYMENQTHLEAIKSCFWKHNGHNLDTQNDRSLCALEMKSFMYAALNSESCIKRGDKLNFHPTQFCDPLGDRNIHWPLALDNNVSSVIMVTARLDASSLFDGISPGAGSTVTGLVTFIAAAHYLSRLNPSVNKTNVIFSLLNGEAFDYIGSSRLVYDLKEGNFNALPGVKLNLDDIKSVIEIGQVGEGDLFLHVMNDEGNEIVQNLQRTLNATVLKDSVPPASVQRFLQARSNLSVAVITNHRTNFTNQYYNSILDDAKALRFKRKDKDGVASSLTKIAVHLAEVLYQNVTGDLPPAGNETFVRDLIVNMLSCYLESAKCDLFRAATVPGAHLIDQLLPLYVGVHRVTNGITTLTAQVLALVTGKQLPELNETACHSKLLAWMGGYNFTGLCVNSSVYYSTAVSPAFIIDGYDMKSGVFSTWTESIWQTLSIRMFLKPSAATERLSMIVGSTIASISFLLVWFINLRADILFGTGRAVDC